MSIYKFIVKLGQSTILYNISPKYKLYVSIYRKSGKYAVIVYDGNTLSAASKEIFDSCDRDKVKLKIYELILYYGNYEN